jgi:hypothetical protein
VSYVVSLWAGLQAAGGVIMGASILWGGQHRFSSNALSIPAEIAPWWMWGALYLIAGVLHAVAVLARRPAVLISGLVLAVMHGLIAISVMWALFDSPVTSSTAAGTYAGLMVMTAAGAILARQVFKAEESAWHSTR